MKKSLKNLFQYLIPPHLEKKTITAVHEDDLRNLLDKFDLTNKVTNEELACFFCQAIITMENLESIFSYEGDIKLCCNKIGCFTEAIELTGT